MARILGDENMSCKAKFTWLIPTNEVPFFLERESAISTALRHISKQRRASPDTAATCEARKKQVDQLLLHFIWKSRLTNRSSDVQYVSEDLR